MPILLTFPNTPSCLSFRWRCPSVVGQSLKQTKHLYCRRLRRVGDYHFCFTSLRPQPSQFLSPRFLSQNSCRLGLPTWSPSFSSCDRVARMCPQFSEGGDSQFRQIFIFRQAPYWRDLILVNKEIDETRLTKCQPPYWRDISLVNKEVDEKWRSVEIENRLLREIEGTSLLLCHT